MNGTLTWSSALTSNKAIDMDIDPILNASWPDRSAASGTPDGSRIQMSGTLNFSAVDGSALWVSVERDPSGTGSYRLRYELPGDGTVYYERFESLLVPFYSD